MTIKTKQKRQSNQLHIEIPDDQREEVDNYRRATYGEDIGKQRNIAMLYREAMNLLMVCKGFRKPSTPMEIKLRQYLEREGF